MTYLRYLSLLLLSFIAFSCASSDQDERSQKEQNAFKFIDSEHINIATFNIKWLGDGIDDKEPRSNAEYSKIAEVIMDIEADVIGVQEIENAAAIEKLLPYLEDKYAYYVGEEGGEQNCGVIYRKDIELETLGEYMPLAVREDRTRPGFVFKARKGNFDFIAMVVHFKSTSRYDDTDEKRLASFQMRKEQSARAVFWADSIIKNTNERDIFIMGDFNDNPLRTKTQNLMSFKSYPMLSFITAEMRSCKNPRHWDLIDHIVISREAKYRFIPGSERVFNFHSGLSEKLADAISDHCPVIATFDITKPDND